jgi:hypothetical protein
MSHRDADRLLEELREVLAPADAEPSAAELSALRRAVAAQFPPSVAQPRHRSFWRSWRPLRVLAVAAVLTFTGTAVAVSTGMPLPIVRSLARAVGLPVDSPALAGAKSAMRTLRGAIADHDAKAVQSAALDLRERRGMLDPGDQSLIASEVETLLQQSDQFLAAEAAQAKKQAAHKHAPSGAAGPTADDDDEHVDDDIDDMDWDHLDSDDPEEEGAHGEEPGAAHPDPDESNDRQDHRHHVHPHEEPDDDPPGHSPDDDDDHDEDDNDESDSDL